MPDKYENKANKARLERQLERCNQKRVFSNKETAYLHNRGQKPYKCNICDSWHLASYKVKKAMKSPVPYRYRKLQQVAVTN